VKARLAAIFILCAPLAARADGAKVAVQTPVSYGDFVANLFLFPYAYAFSLPHQGFTFYPYENDEGYGRGTRPVAVSARTGVFFSQRGRNGEAGFLKARGENRLGWDFYAAGFSRGSFGTNHRAGYYNGHITANYVQSRTALLEFGLGSASFQNPAARWGPSAELALDLFPAKPLSASLRYETAALRRQEYHELTVEAGVSWRWIGMSTGLRALFVPGKDAYGPEAALRGWF